jgi:hypothetical protein
LRLDLLVLFDQAADPPIFVPYGKRYCIMLIFDLETVEWKAGVARLEFYCFYAATLSWRFSMINNSSLQKWERLTQKQLNQQFVNEIVDGLQCSPFEANAILNTVYKVYSSYFESTGNLKILNPDRFSFKLFLSILVLIHV